MKQSYNTQILMWFTSTREATSMGTVFILYLERVYTFLLQPLMHLEIFWETPRTQLGALLLDLFSSYNSFFLQYTLPLSLSILANCYIHAQGAGHWLQ